MFIAHITDWHGKILTGAIRVMLKTTRMVMMIIIMDLQRNVNTVSRRFAHPNIRKCYSFSPEARQRPIAED
jgi:hypothetical protein